jgi:hypothetical protein
MIKDKKSIISSLKTMSDGSIVTTDDLVIHFPERFITKSLAVEGQEFTCIGMFAIIKDNKYALMNVISTLSMSPRESRKFIYDSMSYVEWSFPKGSTFIKSTELIKNDNLVGHIFEEFISKGNVPYYYDYEDYSKILASSQKYTGANLGASDSLMSVITSSIARWPLDKRMHYRQGLASYTGKKPPKPLYIGLGDMNASTNTIARLRGAYFSDGIRTSILNPTVRLEKTDELIRR